MRILFVHNSYRNAGGEDGVLAAELDLLASRGHDVRVFRRSNTDLKGLAWMGMAVGTIWNPVVFRQLRHVIREFKPRIAHFHNIFPIISPSAYFAAKAEGVATVQTLHNFRLMCLNSLFFRKEKKCEDCLGKLLAYPGIARGCYRDSRPLSALVASMLTIHWTIGTWQKKVDHYIALTEFARHKFIEAGLPEEKISVKRNFLASSPEPESAVDEGYTLFVGRLSPEKGLKLLLEAWRLVDQRHQLRIVGDGPLADTVRLAAERDGNVEWLGWQSHEKIHKLMRKASLLVLPSTCYEGSPLVLAEAFAIGLPALVSDSGGLPSLIEDGKSGFLFRSGDAQALAAKVDELRGNAALLRTSRKFARAYFEQEYQAEKHYSTLMAIYERVTESKRP